MNQHTEEQRSYPEDGKYMNINPVMINRFPLVQDLQGRAKKQKLADEIK